jgi:cell division protein FtsQ
MSGTISDTRKHLLCNGIDVSTTNGTESAFLTRDDIINIVSTRTSSLGKPVNEINLKEIEQILQESTSVKSAECFITEDGTLHIHVTHRKPVVRIINNDKKGYYLDREGYVFHQSKHFSPNVLIANGKIHEPFDIGHTKNIYAVYPDHVSESSRIIYDLLTLVNHINQSDFWSAQFEQIYVNDKFEFELIPRIGAHIILFGNIIDYEEKLDNLKTLYIEGFNVSGWNDYLFINLKFKNQIICSKR